MSSSIMSVLSPETATYKIQMLTLWGWADLKTSIDNSDYEVEKFDSIQDAQNELQDMVDSMNDDPELYRVVKSSIVEEVNLYE
jgi:ubiquinone biosynthesis protein Coq4